MSLAGGVGELVDALAERVRASGAVLRAKTRAVALVRAADAWSLETDGGERVEADAVLLAIPAYAAARIAGPLDEELARRLARLHSASTATVFLGYRRVDVAHPLDGSGFLVPRAHGAPDPRGNVGVEQVAWTRTRRARSPARVHRRPHGGRSATQRRRRPRDTRAPGARGPDGAPRRADAVARLPVRPASAQMRVGHSGDLREVRGRLAASAPGVRIAGGGYDGIGIPDCIRQGQEHGVAMASEG